MKYISTTSESKNNIRNLSLRNITLVCIDCVNLDRAIFAIENCRKKVNFGNILLLTDIKNNLEYASNIPKISDRMEYSIFCLEKLPDYIKTEFCLLIQHDGFIINPDMWNPDWLNYDYIGSPFSYNTDMVGNGGFSLRSKNLLSLCKKIYTETPIPECEDTFVCWTHRNFLELNGMKFSPLHIARKFGSEIEGEIGSQFGFHNKNYSVNYRIRNTILNKKIELLTIFYGSEQKSINITALYSGFIKASKYVIYNDNNQIDKICGDPLPNIQKDLTVTYKLDYKINTIKIKCGDYISLV